MSPTAGGTKGTEQVLPLPRVVGNEQLPHISKVVSFGLCMFSLFVAFLPAQSFATVTFGSLGSIAVILLYAAFLLVSIAAPDVVHAIGTTAGLVVGAGGYVPFVAALASNSPGTLLVGAVTCGAGAALLWVSVGISITALSDASTRGRRFGLFNSINRLNFVGNLLLGVLLSNGVLSKVTIFWWLFAFSLLSCVMFFLHARCVLAPLARRRLETQAPGSNPVVHSKAQQQEPGDRPSKSKRKAAQVFGMFLKPLYQPYLCTNFILCGLVKGRVYGVMTTWAHDDAQVGFMMSLFGAAILLFSPIMGALFDSFKKIPNKSGVLLVNLILATIGCALGFSHRLLHQSNLAMYFVSAAFLGAGLGGTEAVVSAAASLLNPQSSSVAFAAKMLTDCLGQIGGYMLQPLLADHVTIQKGFLFAMIAINVFVVLWGWCQSRKGPLGPPLPPASDTGEDTCTGMDFTSTDREEAVVELRL